RNIDLQSGMHLLIRIIRGRIFHDGDLIAKLGRIAHGCLQTSMRDEAHHDELLDAVSLELQVEVSIGEATGSPMFRRDDVPRLRFELTTDLSSPRAITERL